MDPFICNKCFSTTYRGKKPFCLTQCGHVYCHGCIQQGNDENVLLKMLEAIV